MKEYQALINEHSRVLKEYAEEEAHQREAFLNEYGRYLPSTLCPAMFEPVPICRVVPEDLQTDLPLLGGNDDNGTKN